MADPAAPVEEGSRPLAAPVALAGVALVVAACLRTHVLLAGAEPSPRAWLPAALLVGLALGARLPSRDATGASVATLAATGASLLLTLVMPAWLVHLAGAPALGATSVAVALLGFFAGRAGLARVGLGPGALAVGLALAAASLGLLPWLGTTVTGLAGTALGLAAWPRSGPPLRSETSAGAAPLLLGLAAGLLAATSTGLALVRVSGPWPLVGLAVSAFLLGAAAGCSATNVPSRVALAVLAAVVLVPPVPRLVAEALDARAMAAALPSVGVAGGALALMAAALVLATAPGALAGAMLRVADASRPRLLTGLALGLVLAAAASQVVPRTRVELGAAGAADPKDVVQLDGVAVVTRDAGRRRDELLAGHLAALLPPHARRVLVVGSAGGAALEALALHEIERVELAQPSPRLARALAGFLPADAPAPSRVAASPFSLDVPPASLDALVVQVDDPTRPDFAAWFTPQAVERARELLAPGGVLVQRLRADRLGPDGLLRHARLVQATFPRSFVVTSDLMRGGTALVVGLAGDPDRGGAAAARLPHDRLVVAPSNDPPLTPRVVASLREALVVQPEDLLDAVAAGPRELDALAVALRPWDPWRPGGEALRWRAPEGPALALARARFYADLEVVELELDLEPEAQAGNFPSAWSVGGLESRLPAEFARTRALVRFRNTFAPFQGEFGLFRDRQSRVVFERDAGTITVSQLPLSIATEAALTNGIHGLWSDDVKRSGDALVHGHLALWILEEPSRDEQVVSLTWHCPVQGLLYAAEYRLVDGKPGLYQEPLELLATHLRCRHPAAPARAP